jgi:single-strand DNA-binding protein
MAESKRISDINTVVVSGRLVDDAKLGKTATSTFLKFTVASNEYYEDKDGNPQKKTDFIDVIKWGPRAEKLAEVAIKGKPVTVVGKISVDSVETGEGNRRLWQVRANSVDFV